MSKYLERLKEKNKIIIYKKVNLLHPGSARNLGIKISKSKYLTFFDVNTLPKKDWLKKNAIVIDVCINKVGDKIVGDVNFDELKDNVKAITPVPGGVGPMTIACLLKNTLTCFKARLT